MADDVSGCGDCVRADTGAGSGADLDASEAMEFKEFGRSMYPCTDRVQERTVRARIRSGVDALPSQIRAQSQPAGSP